MKAFIPIVLMLFIMSSATRANEVSLPIKLADVALSGEDGGRLDSTAWNSSELKGKVFVLFYVDPDEKDLNEAVSKALKQAQFASDKYQSIAIINMAATWLPNFAIENSLIEKQKKYPRALYLKDLNKVLVKEWGLKDDSSNVLIFNKKGDLIFKVMGQLSQKQIDEMLEIIRSHL